MAGVGAFRNRALAILPDHGQRAAGEVAQAVGQVGIVAPDERVVAETAVLAEDDFAQQEVAQGVRAHHLADGLGAHDVAARLAHLVVFEQQPAVGEYALGQRQAGGHQKRGPENGVEADDFLADQVQVGGPQTVALEAAIFYRAHVADERIEPHVEDVLSLHRQRNAPFQRGAADGKIVEAGAHKGEHFIAARFRLDEIGLRFVQLDQLFGESRELEEVVFLGDGLGGAAALRARVAGLGLVDVEFVVNAILAGVAALIDVAVVQAALEQPLHHFVMGGRGGADGAVHADVQLLPLGAELRGNQVGELLRRLADGFGGALHFLTVFVGAGEHHGVEALHALEARNGLGGHGGVRVPDVGRGIHVVERSREVVFVHFDWLR